jgi:hypothetical protein
VSIGRLQHYCNASVKRADACRSGPTPCTRRITNGNRPFTPRSSGAPMLAGATTECAANQERGPVRIVNLLAAAAAAAAAAVHLGRRGPRCAYGRWLEPDPEVARFAAAIDGP